MKKIIEVFFSSFEFQDFLTHFSSQPGLKLPIPPNSALAFFLLALKKFFPSPLIFIGEELTSLFSDLLEIGEEKIILFQPKPKVFKEILNLRKDLILLLREEDLSFKLPKEVDDLMLVLRRGPFSYERLLSHLANAGYLLTDLVSEEGEFARRGSVIDLFPEESEFPLRVEFLGDEIISLRLFDPITQRTVKELEEFELFLSKSQEEGEKISSLIPKESLTLIAEEGFLTITHQFPPLDYYPDYYLPISSPEIYLGNFKVLKSEMEKEGYQYYIVGPEYLQKRLERILGDYPNYLSGSLSGGFLLPKTGICLLTEKEIYGRPKIRLPKRKFKGLPIDDLFALKKGDYVVHLEYGVGRFEGVKKEVFEGIPKDYLIISYAAGDKLYLPIENLGYLDKYLGPSDRPPKIDRIGKSGWDEAKLAAEEACAEFAQELLNLYARREVVSGFSFLPDSEWQMALEASFPYEETLDQLKALKEIKDDMESKRPMDRLICGDVGYGKTELALRAAFKAVNSFKQVALLAPTTLLCLQHYYTFKERLKDFPVRVEHLSRFLKREEREGIIKEIKEGKVDIVIGTHILLSDKITFKDLGLLIIDEEQKFGVKQKEKIKKLKENVDVLTLSATPIPRTLYLALSGIKDISLLNTPPLGRKEIVTEVTYWDEEKIRLAIMNEVKRGGQVFFIHNRIETIYKKEERLKEICPEVRMAVAHARMREERLAKVYSDFLNRRYDLLLSTAIIQSGIDIPNANTIIVDEAHTFGLSDLHQLRGRVGRGERQGYCLFIVPGRKNLTEAAKERIKAIVSYTKLGSGFKLALRDMEIRGVGDILGTRQHGHISRIGFHLYCQLLKETIAKMKGEKVSSEPELSLNLPSYIPEDFIPDGQIRVAIYKKILKAESEAEIEELKEEIRDRFGRYPEVVANLFSLGLIRIYAKEKGIRKIVRKGREIVFVRENGEEERYFGDWQEILSLLKGLS